MLGKEKEEREKKMGDSQKQPSLLVQLQQNVCDFEAKKEVLVKQDYAVWSNYVINTILDESKKGLRIYRATMLPYSQLTIWSASTLLRKDTRFDGIDINAVSGGEYKDHVCIRW